MRKYSLGSYKCKCSDGYSGDGYNCFDKDEIALSSNSCGNNQNCVNTIGSLNCFCVDIDECKIMHANQMHDAMQNVLIPVVVTLAAFTMDSEVTESLAMISMNVKLPCTTVILLRNASILLVDLLVNVMRDGKAMT